MLLAVANCAQGAARSKGAWEGGFLEQEDKKRRLFLEQRNTAQEKLFTDILSCHPRRIIFNPGSENPTLQKAATDASIETVFACTLVMLKTGKF